MGALTLDELEDRIEAVYGAKTVFDLEPITADLPSVPASKAGRKVRHRRPLVMEDDEFRSHFTSYAMVMVLLFVIWAASGGGFPWPLIVAAAWGIGLGSHYQVASAHQRKRLARARSLGISLAELEVKERDEKRSQREVRRAKRARAVSRARARPGPAPAEIPAATTPEADPNGSSAHRYVVALFVDVVSSTGLNEALGDEGWVRVRDRLWDLLRECFAREGGWEVNTAGDGMLARFEHPTRAACAAVEILRRLEHQRTETGFAPSVRIGIHSGDVVDAGDDLIGSVINVASRVTAAAEPDDITITEHVADHLDPSIRTEDRGIHTLRGVSRPRHLLAIRWR